MGERPHRKEGGMAERATSTFEIKRWDENSYSEFDGGKKLTRARVTKTFQGDVEGEGDVEYLMMYREDGTATLVGLERIVGRVHGKAGSFVLQEEGTFEDGAARILWRIVPGSGTGELEGIRGEGRFVAGHEPRHPFALEYEI
jgi:hypothetical protein